LNQRRLFLRLLFAADAASASLAAVAALVSNGTALTATGCPAGGVDAGRPR
jgi:hypothetical protein